MSWEAAALGAGGIGTVIAAFLGGIVAVKKLVAELQGTTPEGESPATMAKVMAVATEAKETAKRTETKVDAHLQSHADNDVRRPVVRLVREEH